MCEIRFTVNSFFKPLKGKAESKAHEDKFVFMQIRDDVGEVFLRLVESEFQAKALIDEMCAEDGFTWEF